MPLTRTIIDCSTGEATEVPFTDAEVAQAAADTAAAVQAEKDRAVLENNATTLKARADAALTMNATYLAIPAPSAAQNTAQVKALTAQVNAIVRLYLGRLDSTS